MNALRPVRWCSRTMPAGEGRASGARRAGFGRQKAATGRKACRQNPRRNAQGILRQADFKAIALPLNAPFV